MDFELSWGILLVFTVVGIFLFAGVLYVLRALIEKFRMPDRSRQDKIKTLESRLAKGEINQDEYRQNMMDIE